jgi:hypothetical protein
MNPDQSETTLTMERITAVRVLNDNGEFEATFKRDGCYCPRSLPEPLAPPYTHWIASECPVHGPMVVQHDS